MTLPALLPTPATKLQNKPPTTSHNAKNITPAEIQPRREKGLCYYCDEKFSMSHKCPNKHIYLLQVNEEDTIDQQTDPPDPTLAIDDHCSHLEHHLSFNALNGSLGAGTMHFKGHIQGVEI